MSSAKWQPSPVLVDDGLVKHAVSTGSPTFQQTVATPFEVLSRARDLVASGWVQHTLAVDSQGTSVPPYDERAVRWCVIGSMQAAIYYEPEAVPHEYMMKYMQSLWNAANLNYMINVKYGDIPVVNDTVFHGQEQCVHCFDKTIAHVVKHPEANKWSPR